LTFTPWEFKSLRPEKRTKTEKTKEQARGRRLSTPFAAE
jgi:hypothetical protein